ncbi:hypothetical protein B0H14DRAFT_2617036 [Mycena olivaceomarginata]|nr:hypothetical protein B0H14DRAFT_2617036 [Mycena olivaceomarginata]
MPVNDLNAVQNTKRCWRIERVSPEVHDLHKNAVCLRINGVNAVVLLLNLRPSPTILLVCNLPNDDDVSDIPFVLSCDYPRRRHFHQRRRSANEVACLKYDSLLCFKTQEFVGVGQDSRICSCEKGSVCFQSVGVGFIGDGEMRALMNRLIINEFCEEIGQIYLDQREFPHRRLHPPRRLRLRRRQIEKTSNGTRLSSFTRRRPRLNLTEHVSVMRLCRERLDSESGLAREKPAKSKPVESNGVRSARVGEEERGARAERQRLAGRREDGIWHRHATWRRLLGHAARQFRVDRRGDATEHRRIVIDTTGRRLLGHWLLGHFLVIASFDIRHFAICSTRNIGTIRTQWWYGREIGKNVTSPVPPHMTCPFSVLVHRPKDRRPMTQNRKRTHHMWCITASAIFGHLLLTTMVKNKSRRPARRQQYVESECIRE